MPTVKEHVRNLLDDVPDDISWEQMRYEIWFTEQVLIGMDEDDRGETVPHEQVMEEVKTWIGASVGRKGRSKNFRKSLRGSKQILPTMVSESPAKYSKKSN